MILLLINIFLILERTFHVRPARIPGNDEALHFDEVRKTMHYMEDNPETIQELMSSHAPVNEGDIIIPTDRNAVGNIWPTRELAYEIHSEISHRTGDILKALKMISDTTCLTFHQRTSETNYLHFKNSPGCASYVGCMGGEQAVFIGSVCSVGNIAHEVLHSLGFYHEHTRTDREEYIIVLSNNIIEGSEKNFVKQPGNTLNIPYDVDSIMHYGGNYFSSNGLPTILSLKSADNMGQRVRLTKLDIRRVRALYDCDSAQNVTVTTSEQSQMDDKARYQPQATTRWRRRTVNQKP